MKRVYIVGMIVLLGSIFSIAQGMEKKDSNSLINGVKPVTEENDYNCYKWELFRTHYQSNDPKYSCDNYAKIKDPKFKGKRYILYLFNSLKGDFSDPSSHIIKLICKTKSNSAEYKEEDECKEEISIEIESRGPWRGKFGYNKKITLPRKNKDKHIESLNSFLTKSKFKDGVKMELYKNGGDSTKVDFDKLIETEFKNYAKKNSFLYVTELCTEDDFDEWF